MKFHLAAKVQSPYTRDMADASINLNDVPISARSVVDAARRAIEGAGGGAALARAVGVTRFAVQQWKDTGIPAARVPAVSRATGLPLHELRPDLFDPPSSAGTAPAPEAA